MLQYGGAGTSLSPTTHFSNASAYDFAAQYNQAQLDAVAASFPYGTNSSAGNNQNNSQALALAAAAASNPASVANYAYAALAQQAIAAGAPNLTAAYQQ